MAPGSGQQTLSVPGYSCRAGSPEVSARALRSTGDFGFRSIPNSGHDYFGDAVSANGGPEPGGVQRAGRRANAAAGYRVSTTRPQITDDSQSSHGGPLRRVVEGSFWGKPCKRPA